jgi:hypothetical protein
MTLPEHTLKLFIRDRAGRPRGVVVAVPAKHLLANAGKKYAIGWSMQHRGLDEWNDFTSNELALTRAQDADKLGIVLDDKVLSAMPYDIRHALKGGLKMKNGRGETIEVESFLNRCEKYFKPQKKTAKKTSKV